MFNYFKSQWESVLITVIWLPTILTVLMSGYIIFGIVLTLIGLLVLWIIYSLIEKFKKLELEKLEKMQPTFGGSASNIKRKGIIFTVGKQVDTISYSIKGLSPSCIGFICTKETFNIINPATFLANYNVDSLKYEIVDPIDINDIRTKTKIIIDWMLKNGLENKDIALDPTGGLTSMSLGAYSAAYERQIDAQYVLSDFDNNNKPIPNTQKLMLLSSYSVFNIN